MGVQRVLGVSGMTQGVRWRALAKIREFFLSLSLSLAAGGGIPHPSIHDCGTAGGIDWEYVW
jgi:hypothetical protein